MKKLNLQPEDLHVESFTVAETPPEARGTVHADEWSLKTAQCGTCGGYTCGGPSCFTSCDPGGGDPACTCPIYL
jgi:hypothetical protein